MKKLNKILLIDDDEVTNFINKDLLEGLNIVREVQVIEDGEKAFEYLLQCVGDFLKICPELIIFDNQMPNMDGRELIEALHKIGFIERSEAVFMSLNVNAPQKDIDALKELGIQEFTTKPLSEERVMDIYHKYWQKMQT